MMTTWVRPCQCPWFHSWSNQRRMFLKIAIVTTIFALPLAGWGADHIWTIQMPPPFSSGPGLWERNGLLLAGVFLFREEAEALAASMTGATVLSTTPPLPKEWRPWRQRLTLAALGWRSPQIAQGSQPFLSFRLPWFEGASARGSRVIIHALVPPGLHPNSRLSLWASGIPLAAVPVRGEAITLEAPLDALENTPLEDSISFEVRGELSWSGDICLDARTTSLWIRVEPSSFFEMLRQGPARTVRGAVREAGILGTRLLQQSDSRPQLEAACRLAVAFGHMAWGDRPMEVATVPGLEPSIVLGDFAEDIRWTGTTLYLSPKGGTFLASQWMPALLTHAAHGTEVLQDTQPPTPAISLAALGIPGGTVQGQGDMVIPLHLHLAQLGAWPKTLILGLSFAHSAIPEGDLAAVLVRLGGRVLESQELRGAGSRRLIRVEIPGRLLQADSTIEVVFRYASPQEMCRGGWSRTMQASLLEDSFVELQGVQASPPLTLANFPALMGDRGLVVSSATHIRQAPHLLALCQALGRLRSKAPFALQLVRPDEPITAKAFILTEDLSLPGIQPLVLPLASTEIRNPLTGATLVRFTPDNPLTLVQTFHDAQGRPVLAASGPAPLPVSLPTLLNASGGANLMVTQEDLWQFFEIGDKFRVIQPTSKDLLWYLQEYRLILFLVLAVLLVAGLTILYLRTGRRTS